MPGPGAGVEGRDGFINRPCPCRLPPPRRSSYCMRSSCCMQVNLHTCVQTYGYTHWGERAAAGTASSPLRVLRASKLDGSPGLLRWRCCHGGGFPLQYVRACLMTHSFLTLGFISYEDVYITNGVYIFIRKILWSCTIVFLRMSVSFTMYLVRDDLINKWNQSMTYVRLLRLKIISRSNQCSSLGNIVKPHRSEPHFNVTTGIINVTTRYNHSHYKDKMAMANIIVQWKHNVL